jgi:hypothetical protein
MGDDAKGAHSAESRSREARDPIRPWFEASEELGDHIGIRFGRVPPGGGEPEWIYRSHADFDGIGGFADILRRRGAAVSGLPEIPHPVDPSPRHFLRSLPEYFQARRRVVWKAPSGRTRPASPAEPPEAVAWHLFDEGATARMRRHCRASGFTVNSFLLRHLSASIFPSLGEESALMPWMVPVNLRGKVTRSSDVENHSSYVRVEVSRADSVASVHEKVYGALAEGRHWANWLAYSYSRPLPDAAKRAMIRTERVTSQWMIGAFSNLGVWDEEKGLSGPGVEGGWLFMPPAMRFFKVSSGCLTFQGRLSLAMHIHPELCADAAQARSWMGAWVASAEADLD